MRGFFYLDSAAKMNVYFDTEFTDLCPDAKLISIGCVAADGREFYAESAEFRLNECSDFVRENVIPLLDGDGINQLEIADRLRAWLSTFDEPVQFVCDSESWDWRWIQQIFASSWPAALAHKPIVHRESELPSPRLDALREHHALDDAKALKHSFTRHR